MRASRKQSTKGGKSSKNDALNAKKANAAKKIQGYYLSIKHYRYITIDIMTIIIIAIMTINHEYHHHCYHDYQS